MKFTTMNVSLPAELAKFVRARVESGHYASVSEVIREALRLLAAQQDAQFTNPRSGPSKSLSGSPYDRSQAIEAMQGIRQITKRTNLSGIDIEELAHKGHDA